MKKLFILATLILALSLGAFGQGFRYFQTVASPTADVGVPTLNTGIGFHRLTWNLSAGSITTCSIQLDTSVDGVSWTAGGAIASTDCHAGNGQTTVASVVANYVRINVTAVSGGNVSVTWNGFITNPGLGTISGLTTGQRAVASSSTSIASSGPVYFTEKLAGATIDARITACLSALPAGGGICDATGETTGLTTAASVTISGNGVTLLLPPQTITLGSGFQFNINGNNDTVQCATGWSTVIDASTNGSAGIFIIGSSATHSGVVGCKAKGGLLTEQTGVEIQLNGTDNFLIGNYIQYAGQHAIQVNTNCTNCVVQGNRVDQSAKAAILINTSSGTSFGNKVLFNEINDANTIDTGDGQLGIQASGGSGLTKNTLVQGNILRNLSAVASGTGTRSNVSCNGDTTGTTALATSSVTGNGTTITVTTSGWVSAPNQVLLTSPTASTVVFTGITGGGLANGTPFTVASTTATTFTITNANCNASCTGTITVQIAGHGTASSGCSESIQVTDNPIDTLITANDVSNAYREGMVIAGVGNRIIGNHCESCGMFSTGVGAYMWSNTSTPVAVMGDGEISHNTCTNRTASLTTGYCVSINDAAASAAFTLENFLIADNQGFSDITLAGPPAISKGVRYINNSANTVTLSNVRFIGNVMNRGVTTPLSITTTATTGVPRVFDNGFGSTAESTPVSGNVATFDSNGQPGQDSSIGGNISVSGPTWGYCQGLVNATGAQEIILFPFFGGALNNSCGTITAALELPMPAACTVKALVAKAGAAGAVAGSGVIKVYKNAVAQAMTCTLGTGTSCTDVTVGHQFSYAANDTIKLTVTTGQASDTTTNVRVAINCQ